MANFYSKYTGDQIDLSISSGSSVSGKIIDNSLISGSSVSTGSFGRLEVDGNATIGGNITFGDSTSDSVSISADLTSNLIPNEDNTYDLGSKAQAWRTLHVHNISASGAITASGDITSSGDIYGKKVIVGTQTGLVPSGSVIGITVQGDISSSGNFLGAATSTGSFGIVNTQGHISAAGNLQVDGTTTLGNATGDDVTITGYLASNLLPKTINTYDLGNSTTLAWRTLHVANVSASNDITASGKIVSTDEFHLRDTTIGGDTLIRGYASSDDGIVDIYANNSVKTRLHGNGASYFNGGNVAIGGTTADEALTVYGGISSSTFVSASRIQAIDEILVKDGTEVGDTLIRQYASDDDGIIDVYQNNSVKARINGNGASYFGGGALAVNTTTIPSGMELTVAGDISASGDLYIQGTGSFGRIETTIVSSSIVHASGSNTFGDEATDTHTFNGDIIAGHISSSGDISASGNFTLNSTSTGSFGAIGVGTTTPNLHKVEVIGNISASGTIYAEHFQSSDDINIADSIVHTGDTDTKITFTDDDMNITVGNMNMVDFTEDTVSEITFNEAGADLDYRFETVGDTKAIYVNAGQNSIQLGSSANTHVTASGDISSSGDITLNSAVNFDSTGAATRYSFNNLSSAVTGDYTLPFTIATGSSTANTIVNLSGSADGNAFVGIGTNYLKRIPKTLTVEGEISSSGTLTTQDVYLETQTIPALSVIGNRLQISSSNDMILDSGDDFLFKKQGVSIATMFEGGELRLGSAVSTTPSTTLEVNGAVSSSTGYETDGTLIRYRREVLGTIPNGVTMDVSSSGATILQSTNGATITLPAMDSGLKGVQYTFVHAGTATHTWNLSPNSNDKIMGSCIDSNAIATVVEGASDGAGADNKDLQLDAGSGVGDRVTIVGDGDAGWYITECMGSFTFES